MPVELRTLVETLCEYEATPIARARALPPSAYLSDALFDLEVERIFRREWLCVGREEQVSGVGDYFTVEVAGEPIVVVRGRDAEVRALSTVCRHRYMPVVEGRGNASKFVCPYHRWTYRLDGRLGGAPLMDGQLDREACRLPAFPLACWDGFLFVNLDGNAAPFEERFSGFAERVASYGIGDWCAVASYDAVWQGNWKLAAENAMESYHHMGLHADSVEPFMPARGTWFDVAEDAWNCHRTPFDFDGALAVGLELGRFSAGLDAARRSEMFVHFLYPALVFVTVPGSCTWLSFLPADRGRTRVIAGMLLPREAFEGHGEEAVHAVSQGYLDALNAEDAGATEKLQAVLGSRRAAPGPLSEKEEALLHFYRYLARRLAEVDAP